MNAILIKEIMSKNPLMLDSNVTIYDGVKDMVKRNVSTIIVTEKNQPTGIVTERDITVKVVAAGIDPKKRTLKHIMSTPIIFIEASDVLENAAALMVSKKIRKLPVVEKDKITGILSENDIVRIAPDLLLILAEREKTEQKAIKEHVETRYAGKCEICGRYSTTLTLHNGLLVCIDCRSG